MTAGSIKRILVYTHNSIGLGHAFRTLAVITGIKKWRPDIDFLVISGTSIPQIFFSQGIEVIKLPSIKLDIDGKDNKMISRYLSGFELESIFDFRQSMIMSTFDFFQPDALIIEHNMTGQMSELIPLLMKKWMRQGGPVDFALAHVCRGIMKWVPLLKIPYQNPRHRSESINIGALYDFMYVLEDREVIDVNKQFLGDDKDLEKKIKYLGKITNKVQTELPCRAEALTRFGLPDKKIILISLGRNNKVIEILRQFLDSFKTFLDSEHQVVVIMDPYLNREVSCSLKECSDGMEIRYLPFVPDLVDLVQHSELVISRAGYNTVNEILLTGAKAIIIPESHGGGEQEMRAMSINNAPNVHMLTEEQVASDNLREVVREILQEPCRQSNNAFDKYAIGKTIIEDLERWKSLRADRKSTDRFPE